MLYFIGNGCTTKTSYYDMANIHLFKSDFNFFISRYQH